MKTYLSIIVFVFFVCHTFAQDMTKKFAVKSGKIVYQYSGANSGSKIVYFDHYGEDYYEHDHYVNDTTVFGHTTTTEINQITILLRDQYWKINHINESYTTGRLPFYHKTHQWYAGKTDAEIQQLCDELLNSIGGERMGEEQVLGRPCEKIKILESVIWVYKGITLMSHTNIMGITIEEKAVSFDENIYIPVSQFQAPSNFQYTTVDRQMAVQRGGDSSYEATDESDDPDLAPVSYPFEDFQVAMNAFHPEGYVLMMVHEDQGQYVALYTNGTSDVLSVMAMAYGNFEEIPRDELGRLKSFSQAGKTMRYGDMSEDGHRAKALLVPYKKYAMYIMIMNAPGKDRETMTAWADELSF